MKKTFSLSESFIETQNRIEKLKSSGYKFTYNGIDITDIFYNALMSQIRKDDTYQNLGFLTKFKTYIKYGALRNKYRNNNLGNQQRTIIFVPIDITHWNNAKYVIKKLSDDGFNITILTTKEKLASIIHSEQWKVIFINGYKYVVSDFFTRKINKTQEEKLLNNTLPQFRFMCQQLLLIFNAMKPAYVLVGNDNTFEGRLAAILSKQMGIATGCVQHGSLNRSNPIHGRSIVDQYFVYGQQVADELNYLGLNHSKLIVSGWPQKLRMTEEIIKSALIQKLKSPFIAITLSGPGHGTSLEHHNEVICALRQLQTELDINLFIKLHPKDNVSYFHSFNMEKTVILTNQTLNEMGITYFGLLNQSSLIITGASSSALDALQVGIPVITIDLLNEYFDTDFIKDGLTLHIKSFSELKETVIQYMNVNKAENADRKKIINNYFYNCLNKEYDAASFIAKKIIEKCVE